MVIVVHGRIGVTGFYNSANMKDTICDEDQAMIEYFVEQTRDLIKCVRWYL